MLKKIIFMLITSVLFVGVLSGCTQSGDKEHSTKKHKR